MVHFVKEQKGENTFLSCMVDETAMDADVSGMLQRNRIPGLLPYSSVQIDTYRLCSYNITSKVSLKQFFSRQVKKAVFLDMLMSIVDIVSDAEDYLLRQSDYVFDDEYIYVSVSDGKPNLVCLPAPHEELGTDMLGFFRRMVFETVFDSEEDRSYVAELNDYLKKPDSSNYHAFKAYLGSMKGRSAEYTARKDEPPTIEPLIPVTMVDPVQPSLAEARTADKARKRDGSEANTERQKPKKGRFSLFGNKKTEEKSKKQLTFEIPGASGRVDEPSGKTDTPSGEAETTLIQMPVEPPKSPLPTTVPVDLTDDSTVMIGKNGVVGRTRTPWVIHLRTAHGQPVDRSPFRIGKKREYVDFYIPGNAAVGRSHADIQIREGSCWLVDNNSLNHTFVNGTVLKPGEPYQLKDKDRFVLANEEFLFELR